MIHRTMEQFLVLDSRVTVTWTCDYGLCLGTKKLLSNTHPSQGHMEEYIDIIFIILIILKLSPLIGVTTSAFVWRLGI